MLVVVALALLLGLLLASGPAEVLGEVPQGSLHGHLNLAELQAWVNAVTKRYPHITELIEIGRSVEDRPLQVLCLGAQCRDNKKEASTGEALYTGLHHAREPLSMTVLAVFVDDILAKYEASDEKTKHLVATRKLYFLFVVNPDGYVANEQGQGMRRKNLNKGTNTQCPLNSAGPDFTKELGVDLNRNYDFCFDQDKVGSSTDPCEIDYRGPAPFSEPETKAVKQLVESRHFTVAFNYHSFGRKVYMPYGCQSKGKPDDGGFFLQYAARLTRANRYEYGQPWDKGLYSVNGDAADWMFSKGIYAVSPEVAPQDPVKKEHDGFWVDETKADIITLARETLDMNYVGAYTSGSFMDLAFDFGTGAISLRNWGLLPHRGLLKAAYIDDVNVKAEYMWKDIRPADLKVKAGNSLEFKVKSREGAKRAMVAIEDELDCVVYSIDYAQEQVKEDYRVPAKSERCRIVFSTILDQSHMSMDPPPKGDKVSGKPAGGGMNMPGMGGSIEDVGPSPAQKQLKEFLIMFFLGFSITLGFFAAIILFRNWHSSTASPKPNRYDRVAPVPDENDLDADEEDPLRPKDDEVPPPKPPKPTHLSAAEVADSSKQQERIEAPEDTPKEEESTSSSSSSAPVEDKKVKQQDFEEDDKFKDDMV